MTPSSPSPSLLGPTPNPSPIPIRRLSPAEMDARRAKGLCFNCDDKFSPDHRCKSKQFLLLLADEGETHSIFDLAILEPSLKEPDPSTLVCSESVDNPSICKHFNCHALPWADL